MPEKTEKEKKKAERKRYYGQTAYLYPRRPWTTEEVQQVMAHAEPDSQLSKKIQRSVKSIQQKRLLENRKAKQSQ